MDCFIWWWCFQVYCSAISFKVLVYRRLRFFICQLGALLFDFLRCFFEPPKDYGQDISLIGARQRMLFIIDRWLYIWAIRTILLSDFCFPSISNRSLLVRSRSINASAFLRSLPEAVPLHDTFVDADIAIPFECHLIIILPPSAFASSFIAALSLFPLAIDLSLVIIFTLRHCHFIYWWYFMPQISLTATCNHDTSMLILFLYWRVIFAFSLLLILEFEITYFLFLYYYFAAWHCIINTIFGLLTTSTHARARAISFLYSLCRISHADNYASLLSIYALATADCELHGSVSSIAFQYFRRRMAAAPRWLRQILLISSRAFNISNTWYFAALPVLLIEPLSTAVSLIDLLALCYLLSCGVYTNILYCHDRMSFRLSKGVFDAKKSFSTRAFFIHLSL